MFIKFSTYNLKAKPRRHGKFVYAISTFNLNLLTSIARFFLMSSVKFVNYIWNSLFVSVFNSTFAQKREILKKFQRNDKG